MIVRIILLICIAAALSVALAEPLAAQCAMCGTAVQSSDEGMQMAGGLNAGILYLLAVPYLLAGGFAVVIYRSTRKKRTMTRPEYTIQ
jgi:hypothetical protein